MVKPLRESRDRYEELKQSDDAVNEVGWFLQVCVFLNAAAFNLSDWSWVYFVTEKVCFLQVQKKKSENLTMDGEKWKVLKR